MSSDLLAEDEDTQPDLPWGDDQLLNSGAKVEHDRLTWSGSSSIGLVRERNEDRFGNEGTIFAVADGMGRLVGGSDAAESALESTFRRGAILGIGAPLDRWQAVIRLVNSDVRCKMEGLGFTRAGSTLTLVAVEPERVVVAHVGDSRLYVLQKGTISQRTADHTLEHELAASGTDMDQARAKNLPMAGLTSYIGQSDKHLRVDVDCLIPEPGTILLLCSDGVHRYLSIGLIKEILSVFPPVEAAGELTRLADAAGGRDNATAVVLEL